MYHQRVFKFTQSINQPIKMISLGMSVLNFTMCQIMLMRGGVNEIREYGGEEMCEYKISACRREFNFMVLIDGCAKISDEIESIIKFCVQIPFVLI